MQDKIIITKMDSAAPENKKIVLDNLDKAKQWIKYGGVRNLNLQGLDHVMRSEIDPGFKLDQNDFSQITELITRVYSYYNISLTGK